MPVVGETGNEVGPGDRTQRDHEVVGVQPAARHLCRPGLRVDRDHLLLDDAHPALPEQRPCPAALSDRPVTDESPQLAEPHRELRLPVDEDDLVVVPEQALQLEGRGYASEAAAENERSSRHAVRGQVPAWARSSSSWRSSMRRILPVRVFGRSGTNSIRRGYA